MKPLTASSSVFPLVSRLLAVSLAAFSISALANTIKPEDQEYFGARDTLQRIPPATDLFLLWKDIGDRAGFEIGNGKIILKNIAGKYLFKIYENWKDFGMQERFTEVIAPLQEGIPRARLQINVVNSPQIQSAKDLVDSHPGAEWIPVVLGKLEGIQKDRVLSNGLHQLEVQLFRGVGDVIVLTIDGKPGTQELTAFDKIQSALTTFESLN